MEGIAARLCHRYCNHILNMLLLQFVLSLKNDVFFPVYYMKQKHDTWCYIITFANLGQFLAARYYIVTLMLVYSVASVVCDVIYCG